LVWIHYHKKLWTVVKSSEVKVSFQVLLLYVFLSFLIDSKLYSIFLLKFFLFDSRFFLKAFFDWLFEVLHRISPSLFEFIQNHSSRGWLEAKSSCSTSYSLPFFDYHSDQILSFLGKTKSTLIEIREYFLLDSKSYWKLILLITINYKIKFKLRIYRHLYISYQITID
jgi:hypothetical protein